jgi:hypothetical protein
MVIIAYILVVIPGDICIALMSASPPWYCDLQNLLKHVTVFVLLLIVDAIFVVKFVLIFYLKNSSIAHDDFWNLFVRIWIVSFVFICQFVHFFFPGRKALYYCICIGQFPASDDDLQFNTRWFTIALSMFSIIVCLVIYIKIQIFAEKEEDLATHNSPKMMCLGMNMLKNKKALLAVIAPMLVVLLFLVGTKQIDPLKMNASPSYYVYWILQSVPLVFMSYFLLVCYSGKGSMKKVLIRETNEILLKYELTKDWITVQA